MGLRLKALTMVGLACAVAVGLGGLALVATVYPAFVALERQEALRNLARVQSAIDQRLQQLSSTTGDWSSWNDTYDFAKGGNPAYEADNINETSLGVLNVDALVIYDASGRPLLGRFLDPATGMLVDRDLFGLANLPASDPLARHDRLESVVSGLHLTNLGPLLVSARPILDNASAGPIQGSLIMARLLDDAEIAEVEAQTEIRFSLQQLRDTGAPASDARGAGGQDRDGASGSDGPLVIVDDEQVVAAAAIPDIEGQGSMVVRALTSRHISDLGSRTLKSAMLGLVLVGLTLMAALSALLQRQVIGPLVDLTRQILRIGRASEIDTAMTSTRRDEIGVLIREFGTMLRGIDLSRRELASTREQLCHLLSASPVVIYSMADDASARMSFISDRVVDLIGIEAQAMLDGDDAWLDQVLPDDRGMVVDRARRAIAEGRALTEFRVTAADGGVRWLLDDLRANRDAQGAGYHLVGCWTDITERKSQQEQLIHQAQHDPLTGLANRVQLESSLAEALVQAGTTGSRLALMMLDLDGFKAINDTLGHEAGDQVLREVAQRIRQPLRAGDLAARLGGDEFVVVLRSAADAANAAARLTASISRPLDLDGRKIDIGSSIGLAIFPDDGTTSALLMHAADQAMYRAKRRGGGMSPASGTPQAHVDIQHMGMQATPVVEP